MKEIIALILLIILIIQLINIMIKQTINETMLILIKKIDDIFDTKIKDNANNTNNQNKTNINR